jgi:hypothetical protein
MWSGDRIHAVAARLGRGLNLDLAVIWPYLWLTLPDGIRRDITAAHQTFTRATTLTAWALFYLALHFWWWPGACRDRPRPHCPATHGRRDRAQLLVAAGREVIVRIVHAGTLAGPGGQR